jgi:hypothetical protein
MVTNWGGGGKFALILCKESKTTTNDLTHLSVGVNLRQSDRACKGNLTAHPVWSKRGDTNRNSRKRRFVSLNEKGQCAKNLYNLARCQPEIPFPSFENFYKRVRRCWAELFSDNDFARWQRAFRHSFSGQGDFGENMNIVALEDSTCSTDLALCDFFLFLPRRLSHFETVEEIRTVTSAVLKILEGN